MNRVRKNAKWRQSTWARILEVVAVCLLIGVVETCVPLMGIVCKDIPAEAAEDDELEMSSWGCDSMGKYNPLSTLFFGGEEGVMKQMLGETTMFVEWDIPMLLMFFGIYYSLSIFRCEERSDDWEVAMMSMSEATSGKTENLTPPPLPPQSRPRYSPRHLHSAGCGGGYSREGHGGGST